jgi:hypothetical protein
MTEEIIELKEQNELLRKQNGLFAAMLEKSDSQLLLFTEKFAVVNNKVESLLEDKQQSGSISLESFRRTDSVSTDSSGPVDSSEEDTDLKPSSSRDYLLEFRSKESYWRGTKNDMYVKSMAEEGPILVAASQFFIEMHLLRSVVVFCLLRVFIISFL